MIDKMFDDCDKIAQEYKQNISDVIVDFTLMEIQLKGQLPRRDLYRTVIKQLKFEYHSKYMQGIIYEQH